MNENDTPITMRNAFYMGMEKGFEMNKAIRLRKQAIAKRIKILRMQKKISQETLCSKIDVNRITYSGYENERAEPNAEVLVRLAEFYDVSLDYICCRCDKPHGKYYNEADAKTANSEIDYLKEQLAGIQAQIEKMKN